MYVLVEGQVNFKLVPKNNMVLKRVGENATLQWNIERENNADHIEVLNLFLLFENDDKLLFFLNPLDKTEVWKIDWVNV